MAAAHSPKMFALSSDILQRAEEHSSSISKVHLTDRQTSLPLDLLSKVSFSAARRPTPFLLP